MRAKRAWIVGVAALVGSVGTVPALGQPVFSDDFDDRDLSDWTAGCERKDGADQCLDGSFSPDASTQRARLRVRSACGNADPGVDLFLERHLPLAGPHVIFVDTESSARLVQCAVNATGTSTFIRVEDERFDGSGCVVRCQTPSCEAEPATITGCFTGDGDVRVRLVLGAGDCAEGEGIFDDVQIIADPDPDDDGVGDTCDPCPLDPDDDADGDGLCADVDNCPDDSRPDQTDSDGDGIGDFCDLCPNDATNDADGDEVCGAVDNCPATSNGDQTDSDGDGAGDACDACPFDAANDVDGDGVCGNVDNCPAISNGDQTDSDGDAAGDACDVCSFDPADDADGDGVCGDVDNCPATSNGDQVDSDDDGVGNVCDPCPRDADDDADGDGLCADADNCPDVANDQRDFDGDGAGDACDPCKCVATDPGIDPDSDGDGAGDSCDLLPQVPIGVCVSAQDPGDLLNPVVTSQDGIKCIAFPSRLAVQMCF